MAKAYGALPKAIRAQSLRVACSGELVRELRKGRRVIITHPVIYFNEEWSSRERKIYRVQVKATIRHVWPLRYEFLAVIDAGESGLVAGDRKRFRKKQKHTRIERFLDEPDREICGCGWPVLDGVADIIPREDGKELCGDLVSSQVAQKLDPRVQLCTDIPF